MTGQEFRVRPELTEELIDEAYRLDLQFDMNEATLGAYADARAPMIGKAGDPTRAFINPDERKAFLDASCETCYSKGTCSDFAMLKHHGKICEGGLSVCILSFPSRGIRRTDAGIVECRHYKLADLPRRGVAG